MLEGKKLSEKDVGKRCRKKISEKTEILDETIPEKTRKTVISDIRKPKPATGKDRSKE